MFVSVFVCVRVRVSVNVCVCVHVHLHMRVHVRVCVCVCVYVYMCVCVQGVSLKLLGNAYSMQQQFDKAIECLLMFFHICQETDDKMSEGTACSGAHTHIHTHSLTHTHGDRTQMSESTA